MWRRAQLQKQRRRRRVSMVRMSIDASNVSMTNSMMMGRRVGAGHGTLHRLRSSDTSSATMWTSYVVALWVRSVTPMQCFVYCVMA